MSKAEDLCQPSNIRSSECTDEYARKVLDTADIVREAC